MCLSLLADRDNLIQKKVDYLLPLHREDSLR